MDDSIKYYVAYATDSHIYISDSCAIEMINNNNYMYNNIIKYKHYSYRFDLGTASPPISFLASFDR